MLSQDELKQILRYKKGKLYWIKNINKKYPKTIGLRAGSVSKSVYRSVYIYGKSYPEHRVIYTLLFGDIPKGHYIDHKDRNPSNNNIDNLRLCTPAQNIHNSGLNSRNTSGYKGVSWDKRRKKWVAALNINGIRKVLGFFHLPELASERYKKEVLERHFEFANINDI